MLKTAVNKNIDKIFNSNYLFNYYKTNNKKIISESTLKNYLLKDLKSGKIARVGRNKYFFNDNKLLKYDYIYSDTAQLINKAISNNYPNITFCTFELYQLNEFLNHQVAHNIIFISVEKGLETYIFEFLKNLYPGKVFLNPTIQITEQYWTDDMIIIKRLISEAPLNKDKSWTTRIEKILVDIFCNKIIKKSINVNEYPKLYENIFNRYIIDESTMFRYAQRRKVKEKIKNFIIKNTNIKLKVVA